MENGHCVCKEGVQGLLILAVKIGIRDAEMAHTPSITIYLI